jgi:hypothetical protein
MGANNKTRGVIREPHFIAKSEKTLTADYSLLSYLLNIEYTH